MRCFLPVGLLLAVIVMGYPAASLGGDQLPNIVLLMGDDHGWDETGYNGHPYLRTPVLDEMAAQGLRLDRFYAAHPTCSPTRGSVMTGRHPNRYGTFTPNYSIRPQEITIAHLLKKAGYACGHFGKWHLGPVKLASPTSPGAMGFDEWLSHDNFFELDPVLSRNGGTPEKYSGESSEIVIEQAMEFAKRASNSSQAFLAVIWFGSPHEPYSGLAADLALYDDLPDEYANKTFRLTSNKTGRPTSRPLRDVLRERYAEITAMDRAIGRLRSWLQEAGLRDNTLIWYCGDNGTPGDGIVTSPLRGQKGTFYDGGLRVPGLIEWPARIKNSTTAKVNSVTSDILPTLCAIADVPLPSNPIDGIDLSEAFNGQMRDRPSPIGFWGFDDASEAAEQSPYIESEFQRGTTPLVKMMGDIYTRNFRNFHHTEVQAEDYAGTRAWLGNRYKLIVSGKRGQKSKTELYDIQHDPAETKDLADSHPEIVASMGDELKDWQSSVLRSLTEADYNN